MPHPDGFKGCCSDAEYFIRWMTAKDADNDTDGYYISLHCGYPDPVYALVVSCPFCGTSIETIKSSEQAKETSS